MTTVTGTKHTPAGWQALRTTRDAMLSSCDWTQLPDAPLSDAERAAWQAYRQALRDMTKAEHIAKVVWPAPPK